MNQMEGYKLLNMSNYKCKGTWLVTGVVCIIGHNLLEEILVFSKGGWFRLF